MGDEFGHVVAADERWWRVEADKLLKNRHHGVGLTEPAHPDGQADAAVLVDHVEVLQPPHNGGGIELEVHDSDLVRVLVLVTPN